MLKKLIKKEELFYDIPARISAGRGISRGLYIRIEYNNGVSWFNQKGTEVFDWNEKLEEMYKKV